MIRKIPSSIIFTNIGDGKITREQVPSNAESLVRHFELNDLPVVLLLVDKDGYPTKIGSPLSEKELLADSDYSLTLAKAEQRATTTLGTCSYMLREMYFKSVNPGVPVDTINFVLDKV